MNRRFRLLQTPAAGGFRRARIDRGDFPTPVDDFEKRRRGEVRRAHEDDAHGAAIASACPGVKTRSLAHPYGFSPRSRFNALWAWSPTLRDPMSEAKTAGGFGRAEPHRLALRVYYEDTDFSGRVYHASYLRFLERGRTEWLRGQGFEQRELAAGGALVFAVHRLAIDYFKPAVMDDMLTIETAVVSVGGASIEFLQFALRGEEKIVRALVGVAALSNGRPARLPAAMRSRLIGEKPGHGAEPST